MKPITSSSYTFSDLRETGSLYVDKTAFIHQLVTKKPKGLFFLARPRRFGKSLTLSTLKSVFQGRRDLFKGLAIDELEYDWKVHPVIHLDMTISNVKTAEAVVEQLHRRLDRCAHEHNVTLGDGTPANRFEDLIYAVAERDGPVVILIDEYDRAIVDNVRNPKEVINIRDELRAFYGAAKVTEAQQRFLFITGMASFAKVSFFSELNHILPITNSPDYATMFGYTQEEFEQNFAEHIGAAAQKNNLSREAFLEKFKVWYNGYRFNGDAPTVYNPVSTAQFFELGMEFRPFWANTGNSRILVELAQSQSFDFGSRIEEPLPAGSVDCLMVENVSALPLLFQSGYFTIKSATQERAKTYYQIGFPNLEVELAFEQNLLSLYLPDADEGDVDKLAARLHDALACQNYAAVVSEINAQLAFIPGKLHGKTEAYYHSVVAMALRYSGASVRIEEWVSTGIIDNTVTIGDLVYIFEFKADKTADAALAQIHEKNYAARWRGTGKRIILFALSFDTKKKCVSDYKVETP
ncbi:MAG: ATP-binding protein [Puniceicoccales bacterium]|jgi:hypothetical protein|nr:ATP-binding protein [Puniceicoccales bacterium]